MRLLALGSLLAVAVAACSAAGPEAGKTAHNRRDIPPGPGMLTGPSGQWTIHRR